MPNTRYRTNVPYMGQQQNYNRDNFYPIEELNQQDPMMDFQTALANLAINMGTNPKNGDLVPQNIPAILSIEMMDDSGINEVTTAERAFLRIPIKNDNIHFLIDTGAITSVINNTTLHKLRDITIISDIEPPKMNLTGASGRALNIIGACNIQIPDTDIAHDFIVVSNMISDGVLGADFIAKHEIKISGKNGALVATLPDITNIKKDIQIVNAQTPYAVAKKTNIHAPELLIIHSDRNHEHRTRTKRTSNLCRTSR